MINGPLLLVLYLVVWKPRVMPGVNIPRSSHMMTTSTVTPPSTMLIITVKSGLNMKLWIYWRPIPPTVTPSTIIGPQTGAAAHEPATSWYSIHLHLFGPI